MLFFHCSISPLFSEKGNLRGIKLVLSSIFFLKKIILCLEAAELTAEEAHFLLQPFHAFQHMMNGVDAFDIDREIVILVSSSRSWEARRYRSPSTVRISINPPSSSEIIKVGSVWLFWQYSLKIINSVSIVERSLS